MAYNVTALTDYVDQQQFPLLNRSIAGAKTAGLITIQTGVKSTDALNIMETDVTFQDDGCSRTAAGDTTFSQRELSVAPIAIHQNFCPKDLEKKYLQSQVKAGSMQDELPFEQMFSEQIADKIADNLEKAIWQGDTASGDVNLNKFDGFLKLIDSNHANVNVAGFGALTSTNILDAVDSVYQAIPVEVLQKGDVKMMIGYDAFRTYTKALKDANLFHYNAESTDFELMIPGTNIPLIAVNGLSGTNEIVAARPSNLYIGVDLENEEEDFEIWYSKDDRTVKFTTAFKYGVQYAFPEEITWWSEDDPTLA